MSTQLDYQAAVGSRYSSAAKQREAALCCPVSYPRQLLEVIPKEILERDYGCGDPSSYVRAGDTVLDLGAGGGKLCYIISQLIGPSGSVIGVDCNIEMLALARSYQSQVAQQIGFNNISFRCGMIQDLQLDLEAFASQSDEIRLTGVAGVLEQKQMENRLRSEQPLVESESVDCVVSNCVLNLVQPSHREQLFEELFRVLKRNGRVAISDIVSDEDVPPHLRADPKLWSGCISGAWREDEFLNEFDRAGFHGMHISERQERPWQTVEGIEFRSITVVAFKGKQCPCLERNQAVIYRGPFKTVEDDDGHLFLRGRRMAVCDKTFQLLTSEPYSRAFIPVEPYQQILPENATSFECRNDVRHPRETKGQDYDLTTDNDSDCRSTDGDCC